MFEKTLAAMKRSILGDKAQKRSARRVAKGVNATNATTVGRYKPVTIIARTTGSRKLTSTAKAGAGDCLKEAS